MKAIFKYRVDGQDRFADPVETRRLLEVETHGNLRGVVDFAKGDNADQRARFQGELVAAGRNVFKLPPLDPMTGEGVVEDEVWDVLDAFFQFELKKNDSTPGSPTSPTPVASAAVSSTTTNSTASGSTCRG